MLVSDQRHNASPSSLNSPLMFRRSLFNAPSSFITTRLTHLRFSSLSPNYKRPISRTGSMSDVLAILGPLDQIFPVSNANPYLGFLRRCVRSKDFHMGSFVHAHLIKSGIKGEILVSNVMLFVYAKAGVLGSAVKVFDEMLERDVVSWCTLISGFVGNGFELEAFELFKRMKEGCLKPNQFVVSSVLKACSAAGILELGVMVHGLVVKSGFGFDRFVGIGLVDMYAKCGDLDDAVKLFYEIPVKNSVSWNAMISGFVQNGFFIQAVELCRDMWRAGVLMDLVTLRVVANAAASMDMLEFCKNLHVCSIKIGLDKDSFVVAELVRVLSKVGEVEYMSELFKEVKKPDVSLYSLLISGYHLHGHRAEAVKLAEVLLALGLNPKQGALVNVLNLCICKEEGTQIHTHILKSAHFSFISIGNALISMYIKFGEMIDAKTTFFEMPGHDVISWTTIIAGLVQTLQFGIALESFHALRRTGIKLDQHSLATTVIACTGIPAIDNGETVHALSLKLGFELCNFVLASLLHMYSKCGYIESAAKLFSYASSSKDLILTNIMIAGYCLNSQPHKALELFSKEYQVGFVPDQFTLSTVLGACSDMKSLAKGEQLYCRAIKSSFDISDVIVGNSIISMYIKSRSMESASKAFNCMQRRNVNSYEMLVTGYVQNKRSSKALRLFYQLHEKGFRASPVAFSRILRGCADLPAVDLGKQIHASVIKIGLISDTYIGNALVGMYAKSKEEKEYKETAEIIVEDFGPFILEEEKEKENFPIAPYHIYESPLLFNEVQSSLKLEVVSANSMNDDHEKCKSFEDLCMYLVSKNAPIKYEVMQVEGVIPEHIILLLVFSKARKFDLVDGTFYSSGSLQTPEVDNKQRVSACA